MAQAKHTVWLTRDWFSSTLLGLAPPLSLTFILSVSLVFLFILYHSVSLTHSLLHSLTHSLSLKHTQMLLYLFISLQKALWCGPPQAGSQGPDHGIGHISSHRCRVGVQDAHVALVILDHQVQRPPLWVHDWGFYWIQEQPIKWRYTGKRYRHDFMHLQCKISSLTKCNGLGG